MTDGLRIAHLRIAPQWAILRWAILTFTGTVTRTMTHRGNFLTRMRMLFVQEHFDILRLKIWGIFMWSSNSASWPYPTAQMQGLGWFSIRNQNQIIYSSINLSPYLGLTKCLLSQQDQTQGRQGDMHSDSRMGHCAPPAWESISKMRRIQKLTPNLSKTIPIIR